MAGAQSQSEVYQQVGYVTPVSVVSVAEADEIRRQFDELEARVGRETAQIGLVDWHFKEEFIWKLAINPAILDAVEAVIGPDILLLATHFFCKYGEGKTGNKFVAWHQDVTFWGLEPPLAVTAWYAVDDADQENGCMRVIPGTHLQGILEHGKADQGGNLLSVNQEIHVSEADAARAHDIVLKAGQISLHDGTLIHGSLPNQSTRRRCGLTLRYVPTHVKQTAVNSYDEGWSAILVRGQDSYRHFKELDPPAFG